jgi:hypothetical protein
VKRGERFETASLLVLVETITQYTRLPTVLPLLPLSESSLTKKRAFVQSSLRRKTVSERKGQQSRRKLRKT